jgi:hypothetical protein
MREKLTKLLADSYGSDINPWIVPAEADIRPVDGNAVPVEKIRDIYIRRGRRNRIRQNPIKGFEILLSNLDETEAASVRMHDVKDPTGTEICSLHGLGR